MIREISVSVGRTINLGNFESLRCDVSAVATVAEDEDVDLVRSQIGDWLRGQVKKFITENQRRD